jgi:hypothetical protein
MSPLVPTSLSRTNRIFSLRMYARSRLEGDERCPAGTNGRDEEDRRRQKTTNRGNENSLVGSCLLFPVLAIVVDRFIHLAVCLSFGSNQTNTGQVMVQPLLVVAKLLLNGSLMGDN